VGGVKPAGKASVPEPLDIYYDGSRCAQAMTEVDLGRLEMQVLGLLRPDESIPVRKVQGRLAANGRTLAYTTVMTVLSRLHDKGAVRRRKHGNRFLYSTARRAQSIKQGILGRVQKLLYSGERSRAIAALIDDQQVSEDELRALRKLIDERLRARRV